MLCWVRWNRKKGKKKELGFHCVIQYLSNFNIILKVPYNFQLWTFNSQQNKKLKPANWIAFTSLSLPPSSSSTTTTTTKQTASLRSSTPLSSLLSLATSRFKVPFFLLFQSKIVLLLLLLNQFWLWFLVLFICSFECVCGGPIVFMSLGR